MAEVHVCSVDDVPAGEVGGFVVTATDGNEVNLAIIHSRSDRWFAFFDRCSHGRVKLSDGFVEDEGIECARHGAIFDFETGAPLTPPASEPVRTYPVRVDGTSVYVTL
ncbi:MAG: non-heme iron oxygenase ferredoxin subunit [Actinomycetaceae bacterium]|nr:non-heme iron oxygenase ferredoxin subunit [Actinomycetaceae bacterium]